jgi:penicillin-binding protein 1B
MRRSLPLSILLLILAGAGAMALYALPYIARLDATLVEKFEGPRWDLPSRVFAESCLLYPGIDVRAVGLFDRLRRLNYREIDSPPQREGDFRRTPDGVDLFLRSFSYLGEDVRSRQVHLTLRGNLLTAVRDVKSGEELFSLRLDPEQITGLYDASWEQRRIISLAEVPPRLVRAILLTEDQRFFEHHGIDPFGIARALVANLRHGRVVQGGSTLTQQLMKNFFLSEERTLGRKLREAAMAILAERRYDKTRILENYLNEIYLGQDGPKGIFGVWEGAHFYFGRSPMEITLGETALLAGLIRAPNATSPYRHPERAQKRRDTVLSLLAEAGDITIAEYAEALAEPMPAGRPSGGRNRAPHFADFLRAELARDYPPAVLTTQGLGIFTSLDLQLQEIAERAVREGVAALEQQFPRLEAKAPESRLEACLVAMQPQTGEIKAMVGGRDYGASQFNRAVQARRQPGSVFKPFVYLAAFETSRSWPEPIDPTTELLDEPFEWAYDSRSWRPSNYRDSYHGTVRVRRALEMSLNAATARLARQVGLEPIRDLAARMGISSELPPYPSMVLGALEVSPLEIAQSYATIANLGLRSTARATKKIVDQNGAPIERHPFEAARVVSPQAAYMTAHVMEGVLDRGTGQRARTLGFDRSAAGKTGTTNDERDAWFAGFTPDLVAVVWVGFDEREPLGLTGAQAALPIWTRFMKEATASLPPTSFQVPDGVVLVRIDPASGGLATPYCRATIEEAFWRGREPTSPCAVHAPYAEFTEPGGDADRDAAGVPASDAGTEAR